MSFLISTPFPGFLDTAGDPLENGKIYIGQPNLNAQNFPQTAYWDAALTIPAAQPIRTSGGYPWLNGSPAKVFVAGTYSILVKDRNDQLVYSDPAAGIAGLVSGMFSGTVSDLNFDPTALGMIVDETRILVSTLNPLNPPDVFGGTYYTIQLTKVSDSEYRVLLMQGSTPGNLYIREYAVGLWGAWNAVGQSYLELSTGSSPYTVEAWGYSVISVGASTNPYVINLPQVSTCEGYRLRIFNRSAASSGLVKIVPFAGDQIAALGAGVAAYLQNYDQANYNTGPKYIELVSSGATRWQAEGSWMPEPGSVDAAGEQYYLGAYRRLPTINATARVFSPLTPAVGAWSAAVQAGGVHGIPLGAKAIRLRHSIGVTQLLAGNISIAFSYGDSTSVTPTANTAHPFTQYGFTGAGAGQGGGSTHEIDVPLNSSGQFFVYCIVFTTTGAIPSNLTIIPLGYYMGG